MSRKKINKSGCGVKKVKLADAKKTWPRIWRKKMRAVKAREETLPLIRQRQIRSFSRWRIPLKTSPFSLSPNQKFDSADGYLEMRLAKTSLTSKKHASKKINLPRRKFLIENAATSRFSTTKCWAEAKNLPKSYQASWQRNLGLAAESLFWLRVPGGGGY